MTAALLAAQRWKSLPRRERALVAGATIVCVLGAADLLLLEPALKDRARLQRQIKDQNLALTALDASGGAKNHDPDAAARAQLAAVSAQLRAADREFQSMQNGLVQAQHMGSLLQSLLAEQHGLRLLSLRSLPVSAIGDDASRPKMPGGKGPSGSNASVDRPAAAAVSVNGDPWLYRHGVEVRVQGGYADMLAYLRAIESLPRRVRWGDVEIDAKTYPSSTMTITLYTVSLEKTWWVL